MLQIQRVSTYPTQELSYSNSTLDMPLAQKPNNTVKSNTPNTEQIKEPGYLKRVIKHFFSRPKSKLETLKRILSGIIIGYAVAKTPATWLAMNEAARTDLLSLTPRAYTSSVIPGTNNCLPLDVDNFVENHTRFNYVQSAIANGNVNDSELNSLDLDNSRTVLDNPSEVNKLIEILQSRLSLAQQTKDKEIILNAIDSLNEINLVSQLLWGKDQIAPQDIYQVGGNCQITADLIGATFTSQNIQHIKSLVQVKSYSRDKATNHGSDYFIDSVVNLNGKSIEVPYSELKKWRGATKKNAVEGSYILAYAIEKELANNYTPIPFGPSSSSSTLLSGKNYSMLLLPVLSDESIIQILQQSPNTIIKVGSFPLTSDYIGRVKEMFGGRPFLVEEPVKSKIIPYHEYAVRSCKFENGRYLITISACNPDYNTTSEATLTLDELREHMLTITAPRKLFNLVDFKTLETYLITLMLLIITRKGINILENKKSKKKLLTNS